MGSGDSLEIDEMYYQSYMNVMSILIVWVLLLLFSYEQKMMEIQVDEGNQTPSDYALHLSGLPPNYIESKRMTSLGWVESIF